MDVALLLQVPRGEVQVVTGESHAPFDLGEWHLRETRICTALEIKQGENRHATIQLAVELVHEVDR